MTVRVLPPPPDVGYTRNEGQTKRGTATNRIKAWPGTDEARRRWCYSDIEVGHTAFVFVRLVRFPITTENFLNIGD